MLPDETERLATCHVPGKGKPVIQRLGSGLVNASYQVQRDGKNYVLRVTSGNPYGLGVDRMWEARVLERAVIAGLAPVVEYCDPRRGVLISRWVDGHVWNFPDVKQQVNIDRVAELLRCVHALPLSLPARVMTPRQWIDYYSVASPASATTLRADAAMRLDALEALPKVDSVLCHSDLHTLNMIDCGQSLVLLDWEYAHAADPLWDVAGWIANNDFEDDLAAELLASYLGRVPADSDYLRLQLLRWLYDYICILWSDLYLRLLGAGRPSDALPEMQNSLVMRIQRLVARLTAATSGLVG